MFIHQSIGIAGTGHSTVDEHDEGSNEEAEE